MSEAVHKLLQDAIGGFDTHLQQLFQGLDVLSKDEVRDMVDKLAQRVVDLEHGQAETIHFHTMKPAEIDDNVAQKVSADMGPHTAPRAPPPNVLTPEKLDELVRTGITPSPETLGAMKEPMTAEEIKALVEGHKQLEGFYQSPHKTHKISPDESGLLTEPKSSGKKPHKKHHKAEVTVLAKGTNEEYQQKLKELHDIEQQIQELRTGSNLQFK